MPFKIRLKNFQSIDSAEIEVNGFTTIKGPNNTGKSAVLRAFNYLFFRDQDGASLLKHGQTQGEIEVTLEDAPNQSSKKVLCQIKKKGKSAPSFHYELNGQPLNLTTKKAPEEFKTEKDGIQIYSLDFQLNASKYSTSKLKPQIAEQFDQKYLLDDPKLTALVLGNVNQLTTLHQASKKASKDKEDTNIILKSNQQNLETFEKTMINLDIAKMDDQLAEILSIQKQMKEKEKALTELSDQLDTYQRLEDQIQKLQEEINQYVPPEPKFCPHCHKEINTDTDTEGECK